MANSTSGESVLTRVDRLLGAFSPEDHRLSAAEIARRTAMPPATAHRLCQDLVHHDWLTQHAAGYAIGTRLWEMSNRSAQTTKLAILARPFLSDIHTVIGQHVQLGLLEGHEVLFVDRLSEHRAPHIHGGIADRLPLHLSATGVVLLAYASSDFRANYRHAQGPNGPDTHIPASQSRLDRVRREGYCVQTGAIEAHMTGVAVPIKRESKVIAGLGIVTDSHEVAQNPTPWVHLLQVAAQGIQRELRDRQRPRK